MQDIPMDGLEIPTRLDDLTPAWLTAALRHTGTLDRAAVTSVSREVLGKGQGFTGQIVRLRLGYDAPEPGAPPSVVVKLPAADEAVRTTLHGLGTYEREVRFYQNFGGHADLPVPHVYYADHQADPAASVMLLEDLASGHVGDNLGGCSDEEARLAVSELARFHAAWWDHPRLADLAWAQPVDHERFQHVCQLQWGRFRERVGDRLPPRLEALGAMLVDRAAAYRRWLCAPPRTIAHGDFRLDNLFFGDAGAMRPLTMFDWQVLVLGRGVADVAYFAAFCLPPAQRRAIERPLVTTYHDTLLRCGVRGYDAERCWQDYRLTTLSALLRLIVAGGLLDFSSERGEALVSALIARTDAIIADHDVKDLLTKTFPTSSSTATPNEEPS